MYFCAGILAFVSFHFTVHGQFSHYDLQSYLIGLWFSLRTHATQIWQNPQQLMNPPEFAPGSQGRISMYTRIAASQLANAIPQQTGRLLRKASILTINSGKDPEGHALSRGGSGDNQPTGVVTQFLGSSAGPSGPPSPLTRRTSGAAGRLSRDVQSPARAHASSGAGYAPILETVTKAGSDPNQPPLPLPSDMTTDDFTRAVAATVSVLRQREAGGVQASTEHPEAHAGTEAQGGHEAPSWSRLTSATVLLSCTALYAAIAGTSRHQ